MNGLHRRTYAEVDLRRLEQNFKRLQALLPSGGFVCPMVKANAYGHGDIEVALSLELAGATHLGVGLVEEGVRLREGGVRAPLLLFGIFEAYSAETVLAQRLTPVISELYELENLKRVAPRDATVAVHLKFNTGMNRLGFDVSRAPELRAWLDANPKFRLEGVCTHLYRGEDAGVPGGDSEAQLQRFTQALSAFRGLSFHVHALNSSAAVTMHSRAQQGKTPAAGAAWPMGMRPGISVYGVTPSSREIPRIQLSPVLAWRSHIIMIHRLKPGDKVSYNALWEAKRPSLIGVVPVGYADGFQRLFTNNGDVLCRGCRAPVAGTVCMDYFMVDLTDVEAATGPIAVGEEITLIGEQAGASITADELAQRAGTIPYEIFTRISTRVPRQYIR